MDKDIWHADVKRAIRPDGSNIFGADRLSSRLRWSKSLLKLNAVVLLTLLVVLGLARTQAIPVPNRLADYADLGSLRSGSVSKLRDATCTPTEAGSPIQRCSMNPTDGVFTVTVIFQNSLNCVVILLQPRSPMLLGDLMRQWGTPQAVGADRTWFAGSLSASPELQGRFGDFAVVEHIELSGDTPC